MKRRANWRGFTRVELLAVVVMTLLALGWLTWAGRYWRDCQKQSRRAACVTQMKELGVAFLMCAQTEERLPRSAGKSRMATNDWIYWQTNRVLQDSVMARYYPDFSPPRLRCPMDVAAERRDYAYSYTMNEHLSQKRLLREGPRGIILLAEEASPNDGSWAPGNPADQLTGRHDGLANVVFGDGHVQQTPPRDVVGQPLPGSR